MRMLRNAEIAAAGLADWRGLGQALHARYAVADLAAAAALAAAVAEAAAGTASDLRITLDRGHVHLRLVSPDAVHRDEAGTDHVVEGVTRRDVDLARVLSGLAADAGAVAEPHGITAIELALDTARASELAPVWAALLTGSAASVGRGSLDDDVWDATGQVPYLWFQRTDRNEESRQRFHLDVWVAPEVAEVRIAAAVAAGATVVDDSQAPSYVVVADADGNKACVCTSLDPERGS